MIRTPIIDPPIPYVGLIHAKFNPGSTIAIEGTVPLAAYEFKIKLLCGSQTTPKDDIAIQITVMFLDKYIALNSLENDIWGVEQRMLSLPIKRAEKFQIVLVCGFSQYKVTINGQHYCDFSQRIHYDHITRLAIDGDVSIIQISYGCDPSIQLDESRMVNLNAPRAQLLENIPDNTEAKDPSFSRLQPPSYEIAISAGPPYPTGGVDGMPLPNLPESRINPQPYPQIGFLTPMSTTIKPPLTHAELLKEMTKHKKAGRLFLLFVIVVVGMALLTGLTAIII